MLRVEAEAIAERLQERKDFQDHLAMWIHGAFEDREFLQLMKRHRAFELESYYEECRKIRQGVAL